MAEKSNPNRSRRWSLNPATARARAAERAAGRNPDEGITLVEIVVAFTILLITMVPVGYLLDSTVAAANIARQKEAALQLADSWLEILSNSSPPQQNGVVETSSYNPPVVPEGAQTPVTKTIDGTVFKVEVEYLWQSVTNVTGNSSDFCSDGQPPSPAHPGVIQLHVKVTWNNGKPGSSVTATTNIDYPQPGLVSDGFVSLQLSNGGQADTPYGNSASTRLEAIPVIITPSNAQGVATAPSYPSLYPDSNGCFFAELAPGTYTISLGQPAAGVPNGFSGYTGSPPFVTAGGSTTNSTGTTPVIVTIDSFQTVDLTGGNQFDEGITTLNPATDVGTLSYGGGAAVDGGVACPGTTSLTCLATGDGTAGASAAWGNASSAWSSATLANITHINQVACTSGTTATCLAAGYSNSGGTNIGEILATSTDFSSGSATPEALPAGVADVTQIVCPSTDGCYALGTLMSGSPVLLAGAVGQDVWSEVNPTTWSGTSPGTTTFSGLSSISCPTSSTCELTGSAAFGTASPAPVILRLDGDPGTLATSSNWTPTFTADVVPSDASSFGQIVCPDSTQCLALGTGDSTSKTDPSIFTAPIASGTGQASSWINDTFPANTESLTGISCTTTTCLAIGTLPGTPANPPNPAVPPPATVWTGSLAGNGASDQWQQASGIPSAEAITQVACGQPATGDVADCELAAVTSPSASELVEGSLVQNGNWVWNTSGVAASGTTVEYYTGLACENPPSSSQTACAASGVSSSGPIILTAASGPAGAWTSQTPTLPGATVDGIPLEITPASQTNWINPVHYVPGGTTNATSLPGTLYPWANGYSIAAGDCEGEANDTGASTSLIAAPGGLASATIPLGLISLQVLNSNGSPLSGATVRLQASTVGCVSDQYTLPLTDANGFTRIAVPYGQYTFSATAGATTVPPPTGPVTISLQVGANSVVVTTTSQATSPATVTTTTTYLPAPAQV